MPTTLPGLPDTFRAPSIILCIPGPWGIPSASFSMLSRRLVRDQTWSPSSDQPQQMQIHPNLIAFVYSNSTTNTFTVFVVPTVPRVQRAWSWGIHAWYGIRPRSPRYMYALACSRRVEAVGLTIFCGLHDHSVVQHGIFTLPDAPGSKICCSNPARC